MVACLVAQVNVEAWPFLKSFCFFFPFQKQKQKLGPSHPLTMLVARIGGTKSQARVRGAFQDGRTKNPSRNLPTTVLLEIIKLIQLTKHLWRGELGKALWSVAVAPMFAKAPERITITTNNIIIRTTISIPKCWSFGAYRVTLVFCILPSSFGPPPCIPVQTRIILTTHLHVILFTLFRTPILSLLWSAHIPSTPSRYVESRRHQCETSTTGADRC